MLGYGLLKSEQRGNRVYYFLNKNFVFYPELLQMVAKTTGLGHKIRKLRRKLGTVDFVMFSASFVEKKSIRQDKVDMLVVGDVVLPELQALVKEEQTRLGREINYTVFTSDEFEFRKTRRDPFIMEILYDSRVMVVGSSEDFSARKIQGLQ
jgi:predicted nucleotidyltransferase